MHISLRGHYCQADHNLPGSWSRDSSRIALYRVSGFMGWVSLLVLFKGHQRLSRRELIQGMSVERHWFKKRRGRVGGLVPENLTPTRQSESFPETSVMNPWKTWVVSFKVLNIIFNLYRCVCMYEFTRMHRRMCI